MWDRFKSLWKTSKPIRSTTAEALTRQVLIEKSPYKNVIHPNCPEMVMTVRNIKDVYEFNDLLLSYDGYVRKHFILGSFKDYYFVVNPPSVLPTKCMCAKFAVKVLPNSSNNGK
jgi:hypothetical protein